MYIQTYTKRLLLALLLATLSGSSGSIGSLGNNLGLGGGLLDVFRSKLVSKTTLSTVLTVKVGGHEHTGTTGLCRALSSETGDFAIGFNLVELKDSQLDLGALVLDLLGVRLIYT